MIAEKAYQGSTHWLMFLFRCNTPIAGLPADISEGKFAFFSRAQIQTLDQAGLVSTLSELSGTFETQCQRMLDAVEAASSS
jgi:hypothetical protein